jgi:methylmalonyl-CoA/ethylmalonyl-CoA epimerase
VIKTYRDIFKIPMAKAYESEFTKAKIAFFPLGDTTIEFIQPTDPASLVAKFIERRGEGIHHICLGVENIEAALRYFESEGVELLDKKPRRTYDQRTIAFLSPKSTSGVLIELMEIKKKEE